MSNARILRGTLDAGSLPVLCAPLLASVPEPAGPAPAFDRVEGMMLGLAIADAIGLPREGGLPRRWVERLSGWISLNGDGAPFCLLCRARHRWWPGDAAHAP